MGFRADVSRVPVFGLGCAGGVSGLSIAARLAQARPGTNVLLVAVELCSLALRLDELTKANIVATSLFGDGAAAMILRAGDGGATTIENTGEHLWPNTLDVMGWNVDPLGFGVILRRTIPEFVTRELKPGLTQMLARMKLNFDDIDRLLGSGRLVVESAGEHGQLVLTGIPDVQGVQATLFQLVGDEHQRLAREEQ